jgi:hypothetical protein
VARELRISRALVVVEARGFLLLILMESLGSTFERGENPRTDAAHTGIKDADLACVAKHAEEHQETASIRREGISNPLFCLSKNHPTLPRIYVFKNSQQ